MIIVLRFILDLSSELGRDNWIDKTFIGSFENGTSKVRSCRFMLCFTPETMIIVISSEIHDINVIGVRSSTLRIFVVAFQVTSQFNGPRNCVARQTDDCAWKLDFSTGIAHDGKSLNYYGTPFVIIVIPLLGLRGELHGLWNIVRLIRTRSVVRVHEQQMYTDVVIYHVDQWCAKTIFWVI